jgi:integrase
MRLMRRGARRSLWRSGAAKYPGAQGILSQKSHRVRWLESGVHIKAVADLLGHSSIGVTGDIYGHATDNAARGAVDGWSVALGL